MERLTKMYEDGTHAAADNLPCGENSWEYKRLLIEKLGAYEDTGLEPGEILEGKMLTGWIPVAERLPSIFEYSGCKEYEKYYRRLEIAVQTDTLEYYFGYFDGYKWFDKRHRSFDGDVAAWKVHQPFSPQN